MKWSGRPRQGLVFRGSDIFVIPFSVLWGGFAVFWEYTAYKSGAPLFFLLFGIPFVLVGVYFVVGRFFVDTLTRKHTYYGITNDRVFIITEFLTNKTKSISLDTLTDITFSNKPDNSGSISFGAQHPMSQMFGGMNWPGMSQVQGPRFEMIEDVKSVYDILQRAKRQRGHGT